MRSGEADVRLEFRAAFLMTLAAGLFCIVPAWAQSDTRGMVDRLDRLERDLNTLQGQVYRSQGGSSVITSPALGGSSSSSSSGSHGGGAISGDAYGRLDERINALESQLRDLTGQIEKINFNSEQALSKLERAQADNDVRFKELEQKVGGGAGGAAAGGTAQQGNNNAQQQQQGGNTVISPPGSLKPNGNGAPSAPAGSALQGKTPQEQYDYAFGLLRDSNFDGANKAFQAFISQHPQDPLAGNAMYWLGQIPFSQGQYEQAAPLFLNAYRTYPKSAKAGESLLKVGLAMSNLGKKKEACAALARFDSEFSDAGDPLKRQASSEKKKLGC